MDLFTSPQQMLFDAIQKLDPDGIAQAHLDGVALDGSFTLVDVPLAEAIRKATTIRLKAALDTTKSGGGSPEQAKAVLGNIRGRSVACIETILAHGYNPLVGNGVMDLFRWTKSSMDIARLLTRACLDRGFVSDDGGRVLHAVCRHGTPGADVLADLVGMGCRLGDVDTMGNTPLHALWAKRPEGRAAMDTLVAVETTRWCVEQGADVLARNVEGRRVADIMLETLRDLALRKGGDADTVVELIAEATAEASAMELEATLRGGHDGAPDKTAFRM